MLKNKDNTMIYGKVPPQAIDLEEAVLGACMLEKDTFESVMEVIPHPDCFYTAVHKALYEAMQSIYNSGRPVDLLTITEQLRKANQLEEIGGSYFLTKLTQSVLSSAHVIEHSRLLMEKYMKREAIRVGMELVSMAYEDSTDVFDLLDNAESCIKAITDGIVGGTDVPVSITYKKLLDVMQQQREQRNEVIGITSGYDELDRLTLGWQKTDLIVLAARPSQGKTALAINFARNAKCPALIFSLESTDLPLVRRIAAAENGIPLKDIRRGCMDIDKMDKMISAQGTFSKMPIRIDSRSRSLSQIKKVARRWAKNQRKIIARQGGNIQEADLLILIDYLQLMSVDGKGNREQEISKISRDLKELATELEVPIIALSQLNREVERKDNKKPGLANLREGGSIEQDANIVMFIWWEDTGDKDAYNDSILHTWVLVEKNRDGECGPIKLKFNGDLQKWLSIDETVYIALPSGVKNHFQPPSQPNTRWEDDGPFK